MKLLIDTEDDSSFSIDVDSLDTVLRMKHKIEKAQGIPVRKQTLFFQGKVLQDHSEIRFCPILENSRLFLYISPDDNPNQNVNDDQVPQTEQPPSNPIHGFVNRQDFPVMRNKGFFGIQDSPQGQKNQALHQTAQSSASSNSFEETSYGGDHQALTMEQVSKKNQHDQPVTIQKIMARRIDSGSSRPSYSLDELLAPRYLGPVTVGSRRNRNQVVVQTEISSTSDSDSVKEIINIPDSPPVTKKIKTMPSMKLTVLVQPFEETRRIPVVVNANDSIKELRKELVEMRKRGEIDLPLRGYFFVHKQIPLTEAYSFFWHGVAEGDTIEISSTSDSVKEIINIPDSPVIKTMPSMKLTVLVQPFEETRRVPVVVNAYDSIKELRKELVEMRNRGEIDLPHQGYFFVHKQIPLTETYSFFWHGVAEGDTIEISRSGTAVYP